MMPLAIIAAEVACSVGLCIEQAATSVAAGVSRIEETSWIAANGSPIKMGRITDGALPPLIDELAEDGSLTQHAQRMIRLGSVTLNALEEKLAGKPGLIHGFFAAPEACGKTPPAPSQVVAGAMRNSVAPIKFSTTNVFPAGRASFFQALRAANSMIERFPETIAIVGGIDSFHDPFILSHLGTEERLLTDEAMDGMIPGEGSGMLVCVNEEKAKSMGMPPLALIKSVGLAEEPGHLGSDEPCLGAGSTQVLSEALESCEKVNHVFLSFNGEHIWAKEWSIAFLRNSDAFIEGHGVHHPAEFFGDAGAASGAIMTALSAFAFASGNVTGEHLVWCASDGPLRGACIVTNPSN